jgi:hypothetical protein
VKIEMPLILAARAMVIMGSMDTDFSWSSNYAHSKHCNGDLGICGHFHGNGAVWHRGRAGVARRYQAQCANGMAGGFRRNHLLEIDRRVGAVRLLSRLLAAAATAGLAITRPPDLRRRPRVRERAATRASCSASCLQEVTGPRSGGQR